MLQREERPPRLVVTALTLIVLIGLGRHPLSDVAEAASSSEELKVDAESHDVEDSPGVADDVARFRVAMFVSALGVIDREGADATSPVCGRTRAPPATLLHADHADI